MALAVCWWSRTFLISMESGGGTNSFFMAGYKGEACRQNGNCVLMVSLRSSFIMREKITTSKHQD